jgi:hypothetical protein
MWFFNNIIYNPIDAYYLDDEYHGGGFSIGTETGNPVRFYEDYNNYYSATVTKFFGYDNTFRTLAEWRAASPSGMLGGSWDASGNGTSGDHGEHDITSDPKFVDRANRDYRLQSDSPALTAGKGGTLKIFRGYPKEETIDVPSYMGAFGPEDESTPVRIRARIR